MIRLLYWCYQVYVFVFRPVTYGVRVLATRGDQVLLVRHTYRRGWHLPGGGIQRRETPSGAARREVHEEAGVEMGELALEGIYSTLTGRINGHEILYVGECPAGTQVGGHDAEIAEVRFFPFQELPDDLLPWYRARIQQHFAAWAPARAAA